MTRNILFASVIAATYVLLCLFLPGKVWAGSISIAPLRQELTLKPGQAFTSKLEVQNTGNAPNKVHLSVESFNVTNENYDYSFAQTEDLGQWVNFDKSELLLRPNGIAIINYTVGVPASAEPGEKYIAIFASTEDKPVNNITSVDRVGSLLYITVSGNVTKRGKVLDLRLPPLTFTRQDNWSLRLAGTGSAHFESRLTTNVINIFGHTNAVASTNHLILPGTVRLLDDHVKFPGWPGLYRVRFIVGQGDNPAYSRTKWVAYLPTWSIIVLVIIVLSIVSKFILLIRKKRPNTKQ